VRLLFIADGRSPIARSWIDYFIDRGDEVHLLTTSSISNGQGFASVENVSVAFSASSPARALASVVPDGGMASHAGSGRMRLRSAARHWFGPLTVAGAARRAREVIERTRPDLVHALRIPFEGMVGAGTGTSAPLILSVWGTDFSLHAGASPGMGRLTRRSLRRADALLADCHSDIGRALEWGYPAGKPVLVVPGNGGVRGDIFHRVDSPPPSPRSRIWLESIPKEAPVVINPRGIRSYVRNDTFFRAIPTILAAYPRTVFVCPGMAGEAEAQSRLEQTNVGRAVRLLPRVKPEEMAALFRRADVSVSPSEHDGTPNTLLEAMACGCFPVAGDLVSVREWIEPGGNGLLVDPSSASSLSEAVIRALGEPSLLDRAVDLNARLVQDWAGYPEVMGKAAAFYADSVRRSAGGR